MTIQKDGTDKNGNYDMLARHVKNKNLNTIIDIGAWWGPWTLYWQKYAKRVEIFEPNKKILPMLEHNVNNLTNCIIYKNALGSAEAKVSMAYESHSGTNHITDHNGDIVMKTLDSFGFTDVDIIKIDVEGYEIEVLKGAEQTIKTNKPFIQIEGNSTAKRYGKHKKDIFDLLSSWGMRRREKKWPDQIWSF